MARKNLLAGLADEPGGDEKGVATSYPMRGASKSMIRSIDELAKQAEKFLEGETVVELDPTTIDGSFVSDRMDEGDEQYQELLAAIRERGQDSPILVRPHPNLDGRYQIVFGHRRVRVATQLGKKVRAVVKALDDRTHVIAQGQENSARANLSFIERAMFAKRLEELGYERDVIMSALTSNPASLSKMMSVVSRIPASVITRIGSASSVGRERWVEMSLLVGKSSNDTAVAKIVEDATFAELESVDRFDLLMQALKTSPKPVKKAALRPAEGSWVPADQKLSAQIKNTGKAFTLSLKAKDAGRFGQFISDNLDELYGRFRASEQKTSDQRGD